MPRKTPPKLVAGPYSAPQCDLGGQLTCRLRGPVVVEGVTDAPIPWPYVEGPRGLPSPIVCGDLARALEVESGVAILHYWRISRPTLTRWRRVLGLHGATEGTRELHRSWWPKRLGTEASRKGELVTKGVKRRAGRARAQ